MERNQSAWDWAMEKRIECGVTDSGAVNQTKGGTGMKSFKNQAGFTMIELVIVIVILGILAAFAVPRFASLRAEAQVAAVNGVAAGIRGSVAIVRARYMVEGTLTTPVTMADTTTVAVSTGATGGTPTGTAAGIGNALQDMVSVTSGFTIDYTVPTAVTFRPNALAAVATCQASYNGTTGVVTVTANVAGC